MYFYVRNNKGMIREKIEELRRTLDYHNHKYYVENSPEISDREFDVLMRELQELEAAHPEYADPNSPTARVGSDLTTEFQSVEHRFPMLSLGNTYSLDELHERARTDGVRLRAQIRRHGHLAHLRTRSFAPCRDAGRRHTGR